MQAAKTTQKSLSHIVDRAGLRLYFRLNHLQLYMSSICNLKQNKQLTEINNNYYFEIFQCFSCSHWIKAQ